MHITGLDSKTYSMMRTRLRSYWSTPETSLQTNKLALSTHRSNHSTVVAIAVDRIDVPEIDKLDHFQLDIHTPEHGNLTLWALNKRPVPPYSEITIFIE